MNVPEFLGELCARSALLSVLGLLILFGARIARASWRHAICAFVLGGLLVLPAVLLLPRWTVDVGTWTASAPPTAKILALSQYGWILAAIWLVGAAFLLSKLTRGLWLLHRLTTKASPCRDQQFTQLFHSSCKSLQIKRAPQLLLGDEDQMPLAFGLGRGIVLLPSEALQWTKDKVRLVLLHELGHLKRRDPLMQTLGVIACALHWFNPLVWIFHKRLRQERELACDAMVISAGTSPISYAKHLLDFLTARRASIGMPGAAIGGSDLRTRIQQLLRSHPKNQPSPKWLAGFVFLTGCGAVLAAGLLHPRITQSSTPETWTEVEVNARFDANPFPAEPDFVR